MARRQKKESTPFTMRMDSDVAERLVRFCDDSGMSKTAAVERALTAYFDAFYREQDVINKQTPSERIRVFFPSDSLGH